MRYSIFKWPTNVYLRSVPRLSRSPRSFGSAAPRSPNPENPWDVKTWDFQTQLAAGATGLALGYYLYHLEQVPETGRWRFMDISPALEDRLAKASRQAIMEEFGDRILPQNHILTRHVRRVVSQLLEANDLGTISSDDPVFFRSPGAPAEILWGASGGDSDRRQGSVREWAVYAIADDRVVNALASYGTIAVFTGLLPVCQDEHGLAAVLSHEIGHVVARHSAESYSSQKVFIVLATLAEYLGLDAGLSQTLTKLFFSLPRDRRTELEADLIGLKIAARACFDPQAAAQVQERLTKVSKRLPVDFFDTHPAGAKRIQAIAEMLPQAYAIRAESPVCAGVDDSIHAFKSAVDTIVPDEKMEEAWS